MSPNNKHVVFDVVGTYHQVQGPKQETIIDKCITGTCVTYEAFFSALDARLGDRLRSANIGPRIFGYAWMAAAEKEYTYLSMSGAPYVKVFDVFRSVFYRTLWQAGVAEPRRLAADEDREFVLEAYRRLKPRDGLRECFDKLRAAGFTVWALTSGDTQRVSRYLEMAGVELPPKNFASCDSIGVGKPAPASYRHILEKLPEKDREAWFAAAHAWDASAAGYSG